MEKLEAAAITREDLDVRLSNTERRGHEGDQSLVGSAIDGNGSEANLKRGTATDIGKGVQRISARPRLYAKRQTNAVAFDCEWKSVIHRTALL